MSAQLEEFLPDDVPGHDRLGAAPDLVEVRRHAGVLGIVGLLASAVAIAWLARASATSAVGDWVLAVVVSVIAVVHLVWFVDARTPLLVADAQGVRLRRGRTWRGLPWSALASVEVVAARSPWRDGHLTVVPHNPERVLAELAPRHPLLARLAGDPLQVPLGLATRVVGGSGDLPEALAELAAGTTDVVTVVEADDVDVADEPATVEAAVEEVGPEPTEADEPSRRRRLRDPRPLLAAWISALAGRLPSRPSRTEAEAGTEDEVVVASAQPMPVRDARLAVRADLALAGEERATDEPGESGEVPRGREQHRPGSVSLVEDTEVWGDRVTPIARPGSAVEPLVFGEASLEPAADPVIGPELRAARTRLALTVDQLAERTRIRPHVIESIEVDDFAPCGGDFYARGHLRTLCRVLGVEVQPLLTSYDERYAHAPISPRRVFEAELASGGSIRSTSGGLNWSLLVAVLMALVLAWSVARLAMDSPVDVQRVPGLGQGSGGLQPGGATSGKQIPVLLHASSGGAQVVVRNGDGDIVFTGDLAYGATRSLKVVPPVRVEASDGGVEVVVDGADKGRLGDPGEPASATFLAD